MRVLQWPIFSIQSPSTQHWLTGYRNRYANKDGLQDHCLSAKGSATSMTELLAFLLFACPCSKPCTMGMCVYSLALPSILYTATKSFRMRIQCNLCGLASGLMAHLLRHLQRQVMRSLGKLPEFSFLMYPAPLESRDSHMVQTQSN